MEGFKMVQKDLTLEEQIIKVIESKNGQIGVHHNLSPECREAVIGTILNHKEIDEEIINSYPGKEFMNGIKHIFFIGKSKNQTIKVLNKKIMIFPEDLSKDYVTKQISTC